MLRRWALRCDLIKGVSFGCFKSVRLSSRPLNGIKDLGCCMIWGSVVISGVELDEVVVIFLDMLRRWALRCDLIKGFKSVRLSSRPLNQLKDLGCRMVMHKIWSVGAVGRYLLWFARNG
jgi:hypothetical protein